MAIFDNISYGVSPQFSTSPDVVKMDFFSDISSLGGLISAKSSAGASGGSGKDDKYDPMLYNQQVQTGQQRALLDRRKQSFVDNYMAKARELVKKTPGLTMPKAITMLGDDIQTEALQLRMQENDYQANSELHKRNLKFAEADYKNEKKKGQFTLVQHADGQEGFMGYDENGKITTDEAKIAKPMTNSDYYRKTEKNIKYGEVYNSPIEIDNTKGDEFIRAAMTNAGSNYTGGSTTTQGFVGSAEAAKFKKEFEKVALATTVNGGYDNSDQLNAEINYLERFLPQEARRALKSEYIAARTNPISEYKMKNKKGEYEWKKLQDLDFGTGFQVYLHDKIQSRYEPEYDVKQKEYKRTYSLYGDKDANGGSGGSMGKGNLWNNIATNNFIGGKPVLFNNPNTSLSAYTKPLQERMNAWNNSIAANMRNKNKSEDEINAYLSSAQNIQQYESYESKSGKKTVPFNSLSPAVISSEIKKNGFGGIFTNQGNDVINYRATPRQGTQNNSVQISYNENPYAKTTFPISEQQLAKNYGANVIRYDVEGGQMNYSLAGAGATIRNDIYGEGMVKLDPSLKKQIVVLNTESVYQGVERPDGKSSNALAQQTILVPEELLPKFQAKLWANGKSGVYSYDKDDYTESILNIQELSAEEIKSYQETASSHKNTDGAAMLTKAMASPKKYRKITIYQDFQESAQQLAEIMSRQQNLYTPLPASNNGSNNVEEVEN